MDDEAVLGWIRRQAGGARAVFSVCTGALLCGAAGLLLGGRATTHWASFHLLPVFAGVTAGIDGALQLAAELRGVEVAQSIQRPNRRRDAERTSDRSGWFHRRVRIAAAAAGPDRKPADGLGLNHPYRFRHARESGHPGGRHGACGPGFPLSRE